MVNEEHTIKEERKQRLISLKNVKSNRAQSKKNSEKISVSKFQTRIITNSSQKAKNTEELIEQKKDELGMLSKKARDFI